MKPEIGKQHHRAAISNSTAIAVVIVVVFLGALLFYFATLAGAGHSTSTSSPSSSTSQSTIQGIIAGTVTVGPSQPACGPNQSCTEDLTGYSLVFSPQCASPASSCQKENFTASIGPSGHYSILLAPGSYTVAGLSPSCNWVGCSASFPRAVVVEGNSRL